MSIEDTHFAGISSHSASDESIKTDAGDNNTSSEDVANSLNNDSLISLDDYINKALPLHLQKLFLDNLQQHQQEIFDSASQSLIAAASNQQQQQGLLLSSQNPGVSSFSSWSFAQGLVIGQLSVIIVLIFFIKFFVFSEGSSKNDASDASNSSSNSSTFKPPPLISSTTSQLLSSIIKRGGKDGSDFIDDVDNERSRQINSILEKTYYNVDTHSPESLDWFNVLIAQTIQQFREEALQKDNIIHSLNDFIQRKSTELPHYLSSIKVTELDIGDDFPIFSNCRIQYSPNSNKKRLEAKIDIDLSDRLALGIETKLLMNYPKPFTAALPVQLTVSIVRFQACLTVSLTTDEEFVPTSATGYDAIDNEKGYFLMFSFSPEYRMEFDIKSLIGARSKLENIPKISSLIEYQINKWFVERCVEPRFQFIKLPSIWPRSKNTREEKTEADDSSIKSTDLNN